MNVGTNCNQNPNDCCNYLQTACLPDPILSGIYTCQIVEKFIARISNLGANFGPNYGNNGQGINYGPNNGQVNNYGQVQNFGSNIYGGQRNSNPLVNIGQVPMSNIGQPINADGTPSVFKRRLNGAKPSGKLSNGLHQQIVNNVVQGTMEKSTERD